jgi:hypothetical protein
MEVPHDDLVFEIALTVGDLVSCLRASLDHIAWQLALFSGDKPSREICFPICDKNSLDTQLRIVKSTYGIPDAAVSIMKEMQPYNCGDAYKSTHLWRLNKLWNLDKHRHITPHGVVTDWLFNIDSRGVKGDNFPVSTEQIEHGTIMKIPLAMKNNVHFNPDAGMEVRFSDRDTGIDLNYTDILEMYDFVALTVFPVFSRFFPDSIWIKQQPQG